MAEVDIPSAEDSINHDAGMPHRGEYKVIHTDGTQTTFPGRPSIDDIRRLIGCDTLDTVRVGPRRELTMFVDDVGMIEGRPVNAEATTLYWAVCKTGTVHQIHGDVVIVPAGGLALPEDHAAPCAAIPPLLSSGLTQSRRRNVPRARLLSPIAVTRWQKRNDPQNGAKPARRHSIRTETSSRADWQL